MRLRELVDLQMGYSFRGRLAPCEDGEVSVIQMKDYDDVRGIDFADLSCVGGEFKQNHFIERKDLIFRSRGGNFSAAVINHDLGGGLYVVAAPMVRVRVNDRSVLKPEYLVWLLQQRDAQAYFHAHSVGTTVQMISVKTLADLPVALPSVQRQDQIIELSELFKREQVLVGDLTKKRELFINGHLRQLAFNQNDKVTNEA